MGLSCSRGSTLEEQLGEPRKATEKPEPVYVHIYNIGTSGRTSFLNSVLRPFGAGAFHCGVEIYGLEWSFSDVVSHLPKEGQASPSGVFSCWPKSCRGHNYCETVNMGLTAKSEVQVLMLISKMEEQWPVAGYDLLRRNCCHFVDELCRQLGVGTLPPMLNNLAQMGAAIATMGTAASSNCCSGKPSQSSWEAQAAGFPCCDGRTADRRHADVEVETVNAKQRIQSIPVLTELPEVIG
eukprot:TRINITY_DN52758_c0_g1_i1.p1 TRINITY_DN52758_c0_g1~~TRINITY_DN52758_c0_g1_i1.p1  ORF type:complete len:238 (-),score=32.06 TRINITY_DN52758_c0_g1_i1:46-759(-)